MKKYILLILMAGVLSGCNGWVIQPFPNNAPTPFVPPTRTPSIFTATPVVINATPTPNISTSTPSATNTNISPANTPIVTFTNAPLTRSISLEVLGCNTSIDVTHGMGEVTNAFVTLKNAGNVELTTLRVTLNALDEGREHPDKTVEVTALPTGHEVTLKLTVDSTYQEETPIQVEVTGDAGLFERVGADSCRDIGLFAPEPASLNTPIPSQ
jgi:hypothetical protein